jgi:acetolactate synthase I/II/III large subunit
VSQPHAAATPSRAVSELIVGRLAEAGTRALFGVPGGGTNLDLIEAAGGAGLPFVLTATESGGALAAMAQAELTGHLGACLTTLGPGASSVTNGVACAYLDRAPLVVFTDAQSGGAFEHQQFDQRALFAPITNWSGRLTPDSAPAIIGHAIAAAVGPRPGPVHIDCPGEGQDIVRRPEHEPRPRTVTPGFARSSDHTRFDALVSSARKPIVIVGLGARRPADAAAIRLFVERRQLPAMVTYKAKGVVPDEHRCFAGVFTHATIERPLIAESDLIIGIGLDPVELLPRLWNYAQPIVDIGPWRMSDAHVPFAAQHIADVTTGLAELETMLKPSAWDLDELANSLAKQRHAVDIPADGLTAQRVVRVTADRLAARSRVTVDAGAHMFAATMLWPVGEPNQMLISNGLSSMGFALPAAIGAALLDRGRRVVALTGDGGLLMCAGELLTAVREKLPMTVVVFSDRSLSLIEIKQQRKRYRATGVDLGGINWCAVAQGFGLAAFLATSEAELARAIEGATALDGPSLIDARIDRSNYGALMTAIRG